MIEVHEKFTVDARCDDVWRIVSTPEEVVACIPGAVLQERHEDGTYSGAMHVKFGPVTVSFSARVSFEVDEANRIGRVSGRGKDTAGTKSQLTFTFTVRESNPGTELSGDGEVEIKGPLAGIIEAGASIVVKRMLGEFSENLVKRCNGETAAPAHDTCAQNPNGLLDRSTRTLKSLFG